MGKGDFRDISPFLQRLRNFLLGRQYNKALRFSPEVATRSPPLPNLPDGPSHRLFSNYYYGRDGRREVTQPEIITRQSQIEAGSKAEKPTVGQKPPTPGKTFAWDKID